MNNIHLVQSIRQKIWGWPAVVNFLLGGMAGGFYLLKYFLQDDFILNMGRTQQATFNLLPAILICIGFLTVGIETGRPSRGKYLLLHLQQSWMSREVLSGGLFIAFSAIDYLSPHFIFKVAALLAAVGFIWTQGMIVFAARAMTAWNIPIVPIYFVISGFTMGFGLLLLWTALIQAVPDLTLILICLCCLILNVCIWILYLYSKKDKEFYKATRRFRESLSLTISVGCGHLIPGIILLIVIFADILGFPNAFLNLLCFLAGATIICGIVYQKTHVILDANHLRPLVGSKYEYIFKSK